MPEYMADSVDNRRQHRYNKNINKERAMKPLKIRHRIFRGFSVLLLIAMIQ